MALAFMIMGANNVLTKNYLMKINNNLFNDKAQFENLNLSTIKKINYKLCFNGV